MSRTNYIFVDYENVQNIDLAVIGSQAVNITLLLGARNTKLDSLLVEKLLQHSASVQMVRLSSSGKNALDFAVMFYVGRAVQADSLGHFHVISKDTGYDPLIEHLRSKHVSIKRHVDFTTLPFATLAPPQKPVASAPPKIKPLTKILETPSSDYEFQVWDILSKSTARPKTKGKLISYVVAHLSNKVGKEEAGKIIERLVNAGRIEINDKGSVTYPME